MFEQFTEDARQVVVFAQDEARTLKHNYIGTEHLLLGLLRQDNGLAGRVLTSLGVQLEPTRAQVGQIIGWGDETGTGQIPFTPRSKRVLELALKEAVVLGHGDIGPEHLLLGLVRENEGVAARILNGFGADAERVRAAVFEASGAQPGPEYQETMARAARGRRPTAFGPSVGFMRGPRDYALLTAGLAYVAGAGLGILIGWLIWG